MEKDKTKMPSFDAILMISFGGPERPEDVMPFLENVVRGKDVPRERLLEVARHYEPFGGVSPINAQSRALLASLLNELNAHGPALPVYWGNRYWRPMLTDVLRQMADDGVRRALAFVTSAFDSSSRRQCMEQIEQAGKKIGVKAPQVEYLREFYNHPGFIEPTAERVKSTLGEVPDERQAVARLIYTAHSIPADMAKECDYEVQLREACRLVSELLGKSDWRLAYHSRSGRPQQQWLGPQIGDHLREIRRNCEIDDVVLVPIGFVCENIEIVYDLDVEVAVLCEELGINMVRAAVIGSHPRFVQMIRELIAERV